VRNEWFEEPSVAGGLATIAVGTIIEYAVGRQVEDEAADYYDNATAFGARISLRFQSDGLVASKVAA